MIRMVVSLVTCYAQVAPLIKKIFLIAKNVLSRFVILPSLFPRARIQGHLFIFFYASSCFVQRLARGADLPNSLLDFLSIAGQSEIDEQLRGVRMSGLRGETDSDHHSRRGA